MGVQEILSDPTERRERVFMKGSARNIKVRNEWVQKPHQGPHQAAFRLPLLSQEKKIMPCQQCDADFRNDRVLIANDPGE